MMRRELTILSKRIANLALMNVVGVCVCLVHVSYEIRGDHFGPYTTQNELNVL